ncbi:protein yellow-like [Sitodiplosis mosellana]|uniref:protein yellow-like n=1 Tax=Sitodiplosis mosellana TaxID=263140 RepID=UPI002444BDB4|nr:protein yellow-like [Sitodiplosis mosellana]
MNMNRCTMNTVNVVNIFIIGFSLFATCWANNNLQTKYKWNLIDFKYEKAEERQAAIENRTFIPANVIPVGLDVYTEKNKLFLSLPRLKNGVPASLAYIDLQELSDNDSPALKPYPSWQSHQTVNPTDVPDIVSPFHIKVDRCHRLWAVDTGIEGLLNGNNSKRLAPSRILIFDLRTDDIIRKYALPVDLNKSVFSNIAIDDDDCEDTFAYVADAGTPPSLTVYSYKTNDAWQVKHNYFNIEPTAGEFSVLGVKFRTSDALYGLALTEKKDNGYPNLYFHALTSYNEFNVSTAILRNKTATEVPDFYSQFNVVGLRNADEQAGSTVYGKSQKVLFYTLPNKNEIACWKTSKNYTISKVYNSPVDMVYPIAINIDNKQRIWVLSNNMQQFLNGQLDAHNTNFYVHSVPISEAIKNTPCESDLIEKIVNKFNRGGSDTSKPIAFLTFIASAMLAIKQLF